MTPRPFLITTLVASLSFCLLPCSAQNAGTVSVRFLSFPKSMEPVKVQLRLAEGKSLDIEAPSNWFSPALSVAPAGVWSVGETIDGPDGKPLFKELGRTTAPASPQQMLLLVRKGNDNAAGFDLIALDGRVNSFGGGKFLFMNAAKVDIAGVVGDEKFVVKPGQHTIVKPKVENGKRTFHTQLFFRKNDEAQSFFSSKWPVSATARALIFFYHDPATLHIRMHTIRDFL
jgi:hypothetical protein